MWGVQVSTEIRNMGYSGAGATGGCEVPRVGSMNRTQVIYKNRKCS